MIKHAESRRGKSVPQTGGSKLIVIKHTDNNQGNHKCCVISLHFSIPLLPWLYLPFIHFILPPFTLPSLSLPFSPSLHLTLLFFTWLSVTTSCLASLNFPPSLCLASFHFSLYIGSSSICLLCISFFSFNKPDLFFFLTHLTSHSPNVNYIPFRYLVLPCLPFLPIWMFLYTPFLFPHFMLSEVLSLFIISLLVPDPLFTSRFFYTLILRPFSFIISPCLTFSLPTRTPFLCPN